MSARFPDVKRYLLSGVSYAIPFVACGGIMIAAAIAFVPMTATGPDFSHAPFLKMILDIGTAAFSFLVPVLAGYIAFGIADRPGLVPGFVGGYIANQIGAGFLGGLVAGLLAGFVVYWIKKLKVPAALRPIMPILVIPVVASLAVGFVMYRVVGFPIKDAMTYMSRWLATIGTGNSVILAVVLGAMIAFDMGGPVNKVAFFFGAAMIKEGNFAVMGACAAAICIPPIGLGLATVLGRRLWSERGARGRLRRARDGDDRHHRGRHPVRRRRPGARDPDDHGRLGDRLGHRDARRRGRPRPPRRPDRAPGRGPPPCVRGGDRGRVAVRRARDQR